MSQHVKMVAAVPAMPSVSPAFALPPLPYAKDALKPCISTRTMGFHYSKHHKAYVDNLNKLVADAPWAAGQPLEKVISESVGMPERTAIFNNAAQAWNHDFFWKSMTPGGGGRPGGGLLKMVVQTFGSFEKFKEAFTSSAIAQFGSGWAWLVQDGGHLKIITTSNADTPIAHGLTPLLACDVWEHAYYLDYQNLRKDFVQAFLDHLANWEFAESQLK